VAHRRREESRDRNNFCDQQIAGESDVYRPLAENEIRILEILAGSEDEEVHCQLRYIKLDGLTEYNALSYAWGDTSKLQVDIYIDGQKLKVTENCKSALLELRREAVTRSQTQLIWIDAICINQKDIPERNYQLLLMRDIYRKSEKLIIWLGPDDGGSQEAIDFLEIIGLAGMNNEEMFGKWLKSFQAQPRYVEKWCCPARFFSQSWFKRIWIMQEYIVCAQEFAGYGIPHVIEFCFGRSRIPATTLERVSEKIVDSAIADYPAAGLEYLSPQDREKIKAEIEHLQLQFLQGVVHFLEIIRRKHSPLFLMGSKEATSARLLHYIVQSLRRDVTDPRDRIYAHLSLVLDSREGMRKYLTFGMATAYWTSRGNTLARDDWERLLDSRIEPSLEGIPHLIIDYDASVEDIYSSLVRYMVPAMANLNILSLCHQRSTHVKRSWTPDLTAIDVPINGIPQYGGLMARELELHGRGVRFRASKETKVSFRFSSGLSTLSIKGFCFGFVQRTLKELVGETSLEIFAAPKQRIEELLKYLASKEEFSNYAIKPIAKTVYNALIGGTEVLLASERINTWPFYSDTAVTEDSKLNRDLKELETTILMQANRTLFSMTSTTCSDKMLGKCWNSVKIDDHYGLRCASNPAPS
jgi:hypothetical protein